MAKCHSLWLNKIPLYINHIFLGINLTKEVKDLYNEKYKPLKKLKKMTEDGKISHSHQLAESIL
jgi:hypothetical protein